MSFPVKKAVFNLITSILITAGYLLYVFVLNEAENLPRIEEAQFWGEFILKMTLVMIISKIILFIIFAIIHNIKGGNEDDIDFMDERDKLIEMKSDRNGNYFFFAGIVCAMIPIAMGYPIYMMFMILVIAGFVSGILGDLWKIYYYNRGI